MVIINQAQERMSNLTTKQEVIIPTMTTILHGVIQIVSLVGLVIGQEIIQVGLATMDMAKQDILGQKVVSITTIQMEIKHTFLSGKKKKSSRLMAATFFPQLHQRAIHFLMQRIL